MKAERDPTEGPIDWYCQPWYLQVQAQAIDGQDGVNDPRGSTERAHKTDESICVYAHVSMHLVSVRVCECRLSVSMSVSLSVCVCVCECV